MEYDSSNDILPAKFVDLWTMKSMTVPRNRDYNNAHVCDNSDDDDDDDGNSTLGDASAKMRRTTGLLNFQRIR